MGYFTLEIKVWYAIKHKISDMRWIGRNRQLWVALILKIVIYWLDLLELYYHDTQHEEKYEI